MSDLSPTFRSTNAEKPTRVRYKVVGLALLLAMVTYLDRVCIATLAPDIMANCSFMRVSGVRRSWETPASMSVRWEICL